MVLVESPSCRVNSHYVFLDPAPFQNPRCGLRHGPETITTERAKLGPLNLTDKLSLSVVALAVVLWATGHWTHLSTGLVAVGAACLLFLPGLLSGYWQRIERHMMWGVWLLLGGAVCMSNAFIVTKTNVWLSHQLQHFFPRLIDSCYSFCPL